MESQYNRGKNDQNKHLILPSKIPKAMNVFYLVESLVKSLFSLNSEFHRPQHSHQTSQTIAKTMAYSF